LAVTFDDEHAAANGGLLVPATVAQHLGLRSWSTVSWIWVMRRAGLTWVTKR
jgi:hypothetical protein